MGSAKSRILVVGPENAGKTHLLDMFHLGGDTTKLPTRGYYEVQATEAITLVEYGSCIDWVKVYRSSKRPFDALYLVLDSRASREELMEANNALLRLHRENPRWPVAVVWNVRDGCEPRYSLLHLPSRKEEVAVCFLNFQSSEWRERASELFEWTLKRAASRQSGASSRPP